MKIVEVNTYHVRPRWGFVEILTDEGLSGWGRRYSKDTATRCSPACRR